MPLEGAFARWNFSGQQTGADRDGHVILVGSDYVPGKTFSYCH